MRGGSDIVKVERNKEAKDNILSSKIRDNEDAEEWRNWWREPMENGLKCGGAIFEDCEMKWCSRKEVRRL
jgi:hypothetical protein